MVGRKGAQEEAVAPRFVGAGLNNGLGNLAPSAIDQLTAEMRLS